MSPLPHSFLLTFNLSASYLEGKAFCIIINYLVLMSMFQSFSLVHFRKGSEYLTTETTRVFIPLIKFLQLSFISSSLFIPLGTHFLFFSPISARLMVSAFYVPEGSPRSVVANVLDCYILKS